MRRLALVFVLLALLLTQAGCCCAIPYRVNRGGPVEPGDRATNRSSSNFVDESDARTIGFSVKPGMEVVRLQSRVRVDEGWINWAVVDPEGQVRWKGEALPDRGVRDTRAFTPVSGTWRIIITMQEASGFYEFVWSAR